MDANQEHELVQMLLTTFANAYSLAAWHGWSLTAILIDFDITAAASNQQPHITKAARDAIECAAKAVASNVPYPLACAIYVQSVLTNIHEHKEQEQSHALH